MPMSQNSPQGLLAIWAGLDADDVEAYRQWHNCEHMPERVTLPGFHVGHRYRAIADERFFFMVYETDSAEVMQSAPYLQSQNNPTPWTRQSVGRFRDATRTIYTLRAEAGTQPALDAPYVRLVRSNPPETPGGVEAVIRWHAEEHLPRLCAVDGVLQARLYQADMAISSIMTAERQVHGAATGAHAFLAMYDLCAPDIPNSEAWRRAASGTAWSARMAAALRHLKRECYWLDFALWAPGRHAPDRLIRP
jgi:hypothetical protein